MAPSPACMFETALQSPGHVARPEARGVASEADSEAEGIPSGSLGRRLERRPKDWSASTGEPCRIRENRFEDGIRNGQGKIRCSTDRSAPLERREAHGVVPAMQFVEYQSVGGNIVAIGRRTVWHNDLQAFRDGAPISARSVREEWRNAGSNSLSDNAPLG